MAIEPIRIPILTDTSEARQAVVDFREAAREAYEIGIAQSAERAQQKIQQLADKQRVLNDTIGQNIDQIHKLEQLKQSADEKEQKRIQGEVEKLAQLNRRHQEEKQQIEQKMAMQEQVIRMSTANSEKEKDAIRQVTVARMADAQATIDQAKAAQAGAQAVKNAQDDQNESTGAAVGLVKQLAGAFSALTIATTVINAIKGAMEGLKTSVSDANSGIRTLLELVQKVQGGNATFNTEFGLTSQQQQNQGVQVLNAISRDLQNAGQGAFRPEDIGSTAAALGPMLRQKGAGDVNSARFADIVGQAQVLKSRGISDIALRDLGGMVMTDKSTGADLNQYFANLMQGLGSPQAVNQYAESVASMSAKYNQAGVSDRMYGVYKADQSLPMEQRGQIMKGVGQALDRLIGQSPEQKIALFESLQNVSPIKARLMREQMGLQSSMEGQMRVIERMRQGGATTPEMDRLFEDWVSGRITDEQFIPKFFDASSKVDEQSQARIARAYAGPRNIIPLLATGGAGAQMPSGAPLLGGDMSLPAQQKASSSRLEAERALQPQVVGAANLQKALELGGADFKMIKQNFPTTSWLQKMPKLGVTDEEATYAVTYANQIIESAKLLSRVDPYSPEGQKLQSDMREMFKAIGFDSPPEALGALMGGEYEGTPGVGFTQQQMLQEAGEAGSRQRLKFLSKYLDFSGLHSTTGAFGQVDDPQKATDIFERARQDRQAVEQKLPKGVSPVGPQSININRNQIINYGMGYDTIGAPNPGEGRYG